MKVLWFEVTRPSGYDGGGGVIGGWQDSLENIVRSCQEISLAIAFETNSPEPMKVVDGVTYIPIYVNYTAEEKKEYLWTWEVNARKLVTLIDEVVKQYTPDIIHVFGCEWPFGLIAENTKIPVVIHIQGAIVPYNNAMFPPRYNLFDMYWAVGWKHPRRLYSIWRNYKKDMSREVIERRIWKACSNYMGRTDWDRRLSLVMHPGRRYFHVEEAIRSVFLSGDFCWKPNEGGKLRLFSTGCSTFWKGPDMLLKTARLLTELEVDFVWEVAGIMPQEIRRVVEHKEMASFSDCHIKFLGYVTPDRLVQKLSTTTIYVQTSYCENSPNSICEAQCLGVPVVSTNVGGISSLIRNGIDGLLVAANDPWQMASTIIELSADKERMSSFSKNSRSFALQRHSPQNILKELLICYRSLFKEKRDLK